MARVTVSREVRASPATAFAFLDNQENYPQFLHGFSKFEWTTPCHQVGARFKAVVSALGMALPVEFETTEVVPDRELAGVFRSGLKGSWEWLVVPEGEAARVSVTVDYELPLGILGLMALGALVEADLCSNLERSLATLKEKVEADLPIAG